MTVSRRAVLRAGAGALATALINACGEGRYGGPERMITIASGQAGGLYLEFAKLLATQITAMNPALHCATRSTAGSVVNLDMIDKGEADLAMSQADVALAAVAGQPPFTSPIAIRSIGRVYEDYLQLVVPAASRFNRLAELAGRRVSIGAPGSGTEMLGKRLFTSAGLDVVKVSQPMAEAVAALESGQVDALLWSGGVPTPALADLHHRMGIRVLAVAEALPALRDRYGIAYHQVRLPAGGYGPAGVSTLGVANLLVCTNSLPDDVAAAVAYTLVERATQLVPPQALGTQFLDRHALIGTLKVPMHPGARSAFRELRG